MADRVISPMLHASPSQQFALYTQAHANRNITYSATNYSGKYGWIGIIWILTEKIFTHTHTHRYGNVRITTVIEYCIVILCFMCIEMVI